MTVTDRVGRWLGNYRLIRLLERGNFADVYLGQHLHLDTQAAIKVLHGRLVNHDLTDFLAEVRTIAHLRHPHIIQVLDFGIEGTSPFLVMDYAPNGNLRHRHPKGTRLPLDTIVSYVKQVADALQYTHQEKLIHRDIKPENMLLGRNNEVLLSDFGIAIVALGMHSQHSRETAGTIAYMAPEQLQARPGFASDQYALGIVVYEWLSGDRPFHGPFPELVMKHTLVPPPSLREQVPTIPLAVEQVVFTALAKDPQQRFEDVRTFAAALEEACGPASRASRAQSPEQTLPVPPPERPAGARQVFTNTPPTGTVTFLFTDTEGPTQLFRQLGDRYAFVLTEYRHLLRVAFWQWGGYEADTQGEAFFAAFARARDAVSAAVAAQRALASHPWPEDVAIRVGMGLHTGEPEWSTAGYVGLNVHYAAQLMRCAHGGQVLLSQTTRDLVEHHLPEGVSLRDVGEHCLRDFPDSRRLFQLVISDLPADFPPLKTPDIQLNNLPTQLTTLIGREQEVAVVCPLLRQTNVRLVTLTGTGGIGKTRLGLEVATELLNTFTDGICFAPLASVNNPRLVIPTIAQLLGLVHQQRGQQQGIEHMEYLKAFLRDKHLLLVLDNFEQVASAALDLIDLLASCPRLKLLVTSRAALRVQGEHEFPVPPLALPKRTNLPAIEVLAQYPAVALFLQRALAIKPDLALTKANMQAIATICVHLDGLPLAIELAAARIKMLPPQALFQRLTHRLEVLTGGARNAPLRQQTLRNTLAWGYNLLDEADQRLFRQLSVFVGGGTLEAIESLSGAVAGGTALVLEGVASLIDKSLLQQIEQEGEEPRFVMLETIREYGLEVLIASGEMEITRQAHAAYYLALAEEAEPEFGGPQQAAWLERLEREHDNLRAALHWLVEQAGAERAEYRIEMALRLGGALRRFWLVHAHVNEGLDFLERALAASAEIAAPVRAKALIAAANLAIAQSEYDRGETLCREGLALSRELGDQSSTAFSLYLLGWTLRDSGNPAARSLIEEALALFRALGDKERVAWSVYTLAFLDSSQGEYARARTLLEESVALHRDLGQKRGIAWSLVHLAQVLFDTQGDQATRHSRLEEGLALFKGLGDKDGIAYTNALLGQIALSQGDIATAHSLQQETVKLYREMGPWRGEGIARSLVLLARVLVLQGDDIAARAAYEESLAIARGTNRKGLIATCLQGLANVIAVQGKPAWAAQLWGAAEAMREASGLPISPAERADDERLVAAARDRLGERPFAARWAEGRSMTPEQALAAQGGGAVRSTTTSVTAPPTYPAGLTAREVEVLRLVARGLTNAQIAQELVLSEKTVATHLTHIFNKTNSENRAGAVAFAIHHGLM